MRAGTGPAPTVLAAKVQIINESAKKSRGKYGGNGGKILSEWEEKPFKVDGSPEHIGRKQ